MYSKKSTLKKMSKKPVKRSKSRLNVKRRKINSKRVTTKRKTKKSNKKNRKSQKKQLGGEPLYGHGGNSSEPAFMKCNSVPDCESNNVQCTDSQEAKYKSCLSTGQFNR
jgi:hypothetical protein